MERITIVSQPASEPVTLATAKTHLALAQAFTDYDSYITGLISAARMKCETLLNQSLLTQTICLFMDEFPVGGGYFNRQIRQLGPTTPFWLPASTFPIPLFRPPVQSILSVKYYDYNNNQITIDPTTYVFEQGSPARIAPLYGKTWPVAQPRIGSIQITYVVGYADSAASLDPGTLNVLTTAMLFWIGRMYENRGDDSVDVPDGVMRSILAPLDHGAYG